MHYLLIYKVVDQYVERRQPYRQEHLELAQEFADRGELELGGALADPVDQAILLFNVEDPKQIDQFVSRDPYVRYGLVHSWQIRKWMTVIGKTAQVKL
ncbi:MAG: YciI-like protein [Pirellula sp.]